MPKLTLMIVLAAVLLILNGCGSSDTTNTKEEASAEGAETTFTLNIAYSGGLYEDLMNDISDKAAELSDGRIQGDIIASGTMGGERELGEAVQLGTLDMTFLSENGAETLIGGLGWSFLPFMISDYDEADEYHLNDGWIREEIFNQLKENGLVPIASYENGLRSFGTTKDPVESLADFKGQKVRVPEQPDLLKFYTLAGAIPVGISGSEVLTALEQGTIDAVDNTIYNFKANGYIDTLESITVLNSQYTGNSVVVSPAFWDGLSEGDQAIIKEAAEYASNKHTTERRKGEEEVIKEYTEKGLEFIEPSPELMADMKEIGRQIWDEFGDDFDPEIMERIEEEFGHKLE